MGANIYWRQVSEKRHDLPTGTPSRFISTMDELFGPPPWRLSMDKDYDTVRVLNATGEDPYNELYVQLVAHGELEVWPEY